MWAAPQSSRYVTMSCPNTWATILSADPPQNSEALPSLVEWPFGIVLKIWHNFMAVLSFSHLCRGCFGTELDDFLPQPGRLLHLFTKHFPICLPFWMPIQRTRRWTANHHHIVIISYHSQSFWTTVKKHHPIIISSSLDIFLTKVSRNADPTNQ